VELQPRGGQRGAAIVGEGAAHRATVAPHDLSLMVGTPLKLPFNGPNAPYMLFEFLLGMAIGVIDRLGGFAEIMEVTQLVRHLG
jgi:hypothetical protein